MAQAYSLGAALSGAIAFAVGRPILRLKGHYLAVATLGFGLLVAIVLTNEARLDRWAGRHERAEPDLVRLARARVGHLVLDSGQRHFSSDSCSRST